MPHLLANGLFRMAFEHLWDYFHPKYLASGFFQLFQLCSHVAHDQIPPQIAHVLGTT